MLQHRPFAIFSVTTTIVKPNLQTNCNTWTK